MLNMATQRVVALVDMDCFYCQVEERLNPSLKGKPVAVVQYNQWKGGGIIAVNYEARDRGVTRYMRGDEAKEICPEISLVSVPTVRGKADLTNYRDAGDEVAEIISEFSDCVQRASIDEAYLDLTKAVQDYIGSHKGELNTVDFPNTFVMGQCDLKNKSEEHRLKGLTEWLEIVESEKNRESPDYLLAVGAIIVGKMRSEILKRTGFHCSAGIAHNKILAKLTAGLHKPKGQTILPQDAVPELYETLPVHKVRNLGGKLGRQVSEKLSINYMSELFKFSLEELQEKFDEKTRQNNAKHKGTTKVLQFASEKSQDGAGYSMHRHVQVCTEADRIINWLHNIARGIDLEPVASRLRPESIGCCKNFPGKNALTSRAEVEHWLKEFATEMSERLSKDLERNKRRAKLLTVSFCQETSMTRCGALNSYEEGRIVNDALEILRKCNVVPASNDAWIPPIKSLGLSAGKFAEETPSIEKYFKCSKDTELTKRSVDLTFYSETPSSFKSDRNLKSNGPVDTEKGSCEENNISDGSAEVKSEDDTQSKASFFLKYLSNMTESRLAKGKKDNPPTEEVRNDDGDEEGETWISLTEVFPDVNEAESEVVECLPEPLQKKFREKLRSVNGESSTSGVVLQNGWPRKPETEICKECSKKIPKREALIHADYHAAVRLYSEINRPANNSVGGTAKKNKVKKSESLSKRKRKEVVVPSKKMKSLTAFFAPSTKE